ncbi:hypothetical protein [Amycolatopsis sp.]|uniref:hypothetical protein n=1 Tax=Amycolatopsis sp. TaxID=37632 RepID=UPI002D7FCC0D|nr:hypothetical protein [Amycolatopsis sp.]HET6706606.1 hypothetical protein [Amycolatopsis sp.]
MELPGPDPEAMRLGKQLEAALIVAVTPGGTVAPAVEIADQLVDRRLLSGPRGRVLAMQLVELSLQHLAAAGQRPDPYAAYAHHLVRTGVCTQFDLEAAFLGRLLSTGLEQGWLDAALYDRLAAAGGDDAAFRQAMAHIERRGA